MRTTSQAQEGGVVLGHQSGSSFPARWAVICARHGGEGHIAVSPALGRGKLGSQWHWASPAELWYTIGDLVGRQRESLWLVSLDLPATARDAGLWSQVESARVRVLSWVTGGPPDILVLRVRGCRVIWVDLGNYLRAGWRQLEEWCAHRGEPYSRPSSAECPEVPDTALGVDWLARAWSRLGALWTTERMGRWRTTSSGCALAAVRGRYHEADIDCRQPPEAQALSRAAYYGGRSEIFRVGRVPGPIYTLDVRSMYAHLMAQYQLPCRLVDSGDGCPAGALDAGQVGSLAASVDVDASGHLAVPVRDDRARGRYRRVRYLEGMCTTVLAGPELGVVWGQGQILAWRRWCRYEMAGALGRFATRALELRATARAREQWLEECWLKQIANSLTGRFARRNHEWVRARYERTPAVWHGDWEVRHRDGRTIHYRHTGDQVEVEVVGGEPRDSFAPISAWITSAARVVMATVIRLAGADQVYRIDTDAVDLSAVGYRRILADGTSIDDRPGALRLVSEVPERTYLGPRHWLKRDLEYRGGVPVRTNVPKSEIAQMVERAILRLRAQGYEADRDGTIRPVIRV